MKNVNMVLNLDGKKLVDRDGFEKMTKHLQERLPQKGIVLISSFGDTANQLADLVQLHHQKNEATYEKFTVISAWYFELLKQLFEETNEIFVTLNDCLVEIEWAIEDDPHPDERYTFDQIVGVGSLIASKIVAAYLAKMNIECHWQDARDIILTDNNYRAANVDWEATQSRWRAYGESAIETYNILVMPAGIASSSENFTTTFIDKGQEESASIFAKCLASSFASISV